MNNYKLKIQYDGTNYAGWQIQNNALTIQESLTKAINVLIKENVNLIGSGRTDAGVHALGQAANFKTENDLDLFKFKHSLNSIIPIDIAVNEIQKVNAEFHARFDAKRRIYLYLISKYKSPFFNRYSYFYHDNLDCNFLNKLSETLIGSRDYTSFARKNSDVDNKFCNVYEVNWKQTKGMIIFRIEADRFLHGMVRTIIGTLLKAAKENLDSKYIEDVFSSMDRETAGEAVPAKGLFLYKVKY